MRRNTQLERAMFNAGVTTSSLAKKVGLSPDTVWRAVKGESPSAPTAKKIADYFDVQPTDLFPLDGDVAQNGQAA